MSSFPVIGISFLSVLKCVSVALMQPPISILPTIRRLVTSNSKSEGCCATETQSGIHVESEAAPVREHSCVPKVDSR